MKPLDETSGDSVKVSVRVTKDQADWLDAHWPTRSKGLRAALALAIRVAKRKAAQSSQETSHD